MDYFVTDDLRTRIAAVHQAHRWGVFRCDDGYARTCCRCQWREIADGPTHAEHVADAVIAVVSDEYINSRGMFHEPDRCLGCEECNDLNNCNPHPDAPHGFDRNASHNEGRSVCDCEHWSPPDDDDPYEAKADAERQQWADDEGIPR